MARTKQYYIAQYETRKLTRRNRHRHKQAQFYKDINLFVVVEKQKQVQHMSTHCEVSYSLETFFSTKKDTIATKFELFKISLIRADTK